MIVLKTIATTQNFKVIPRVYADEFTLSVRDDSTNVIKTYQVTGATTSGNYLTFSQAFSPVLVVGHFYDL